MAASPCLAAAETESARFDFEDDEVGSAPKQWILRPPEGYKVEVAKGKAARGTKYVHLYSQGDMSHARIGNLMYSVDATPYRGKKVRFRAAVRADVAGENTVHLWFRVDRPDKKTGFFDNMDDRPVKSSAAWKYHEIVGKVHDDAVRLNFGVFLRKEGEAFFDDVTIEVVE